MKKYSYKRKNLKSFYFTSFFLLILIITLAIFVFNVGKTQTTQQRAAGQCIPGCIDSQTKLNNCPSGRIQYNPDCSNFLTYPKPYCNCPVTPTSTPTPRRTIAPTSTPRPMATPTRTPLEPAKNLKVNCGSDDFVTLQGEYPDNVGYSRFRLCDLTVDPYCLNSTYFVPMTRTPPAPLMINTTAIRNHQHSWQIDRYYSDGTPGPGSAGPIFQCSLVSLSAPTNLSARCQGSNQIWLEWNLVPAAQYYTVTYCDHTADPNCTRTVSANTNIPIKAFSVTAGHWYGWWVKGYNASGVPGPSTTASNWFRCQ